MNSGHSSRPSSSSPATSSSMPSVSNVDYSDGAAPKGEEVGEDGGGGGVKNSSQKERDRPHAPVANILDHDDKRPHALVAKILENENKQANSNSGNKQQLQQQLPQSGSDDDNKSSNGSSKIPNLLNSGAFPPPPHSPHRHSHDSLSSPPTIIASPNLTSPHIPAAPPTTPYTPSIPFPTADNLTSSSSLPTVPMQFPPSSNSPPLNSHSSSLPPTNDAATTTSSSTIISTLLNQQPLDPHYNHLLHQSLLQTQSNEQHRIQQQTQHETQNYTTIDEYRHALSRERRHSLTLSLELTYYKFLSRYQSCSLYSNLEMNEEARLNKLIKNIDCMKKDMKEDKIRCVMELEREEEGIVNGLMGRLEDVRREKMLLERQVYSGAGGVGGGFESSMMQQHQGRQIPTLVSQLDRMQVGSATTTNNDVGNGQQDLSAVQLQQQQQQQQSPSTARSVPSAVDVFPCLKESDDGGDEIDNEDDNEEEEEDSNDDDILEGHHHDVEMEEELKKILKLKDSKK